MKTGIMDIMVTRMAKEANKAKKLICSIIVILVSILIQNWLAYATCDWTSYDSDTGNTRFVQSSCSPGTRLNNSWVFCDVLNGNEHTGILVSGDIVFIKTKDFKIKKLDIATGKETMWLESFKYNWMCGISGDRIVVYLESKGNYYIQCIDINTKKVYWEKPSCSSIGFCLMNDKYFLHHYICRDDSGSELGSGLECIDTKTGRVYWGLKTGRINRMVMDDSYLVHEVNDELLCVDIKTGFTKWTREKPDQSLFSNVMIKENLVYSKNMHIDFDNLKNEYTDLVVYDLKTGKTKWQKKHEAIEDFCCGGSIEATINDKSFFLTIADKMYCYDRYTGKLAWEYKHSTNVYQPTSTEKHLLLS
ncbi:MAG: PQQ-binding-like beta-propeller repeat protein [Caldisericia bacterium]